VAHEDPHDVVPVTEKQMGSNAAVDSTGHCQYDSRHTVIVGERTHGVSRWLETAVRVPGCVPRPDLVRSGAILDRKGLFYNPESCEKQSPRPVSHAGREPIARESQDSMEKELIDRAKTIREQLVHLKDSL
jgi:hypothetical protein